MFDYWHLVCYNKGYMRFLKLLIIYWLVMITTNSLLAMLLFSNYWYLFTFLQNVNSMILTFLFGYYYAKSK